jgi:hypothetical protein
MKYLEASNFSSTCFSIAQETESSWVKNLYLFRNDKERRTQELSTPKFTMEGSTIFRESQSAPVLQRVPLRFCILLRMGQEETCPTGTATKHKT